MEYFSTKLWSAAAVALVVTADPAFAAPINLTNPSFEAPTASTTGSNPFFLNGPNNGWTYTPSGVGLAGVLNINPATGGATGYSNQNAPDGSQIGFLGNGANIAQTTGTMFQTGTNYTLNFQAGVDINNAWTPLTVAFYAGDTSQVLQSTAIVAPPAVTGYFGAESISLDLANSAYSGDLGIEFISSSDYDFVDAISLSSDVAADCAVPEPASLSMLGVGLLAFAMSRRSRNGGMTFAA